MFINNCFTCFSGFKKFLPHPCCFCKRYQRFSSISHKAFKSGRERESNQRFFYGDEASWIKAKQKALLYSQLPRDRRKPYNIGKLLFQFPQCFQYNVTSDV